VDAVLAKLRGDHYHSTGLTRLDLHLSDLTTLTPETAAALAKFTGASLYLGNLKTLDPDAAAALAKCKAKVSLPYTMKLPKP
jgi:hypothetical protein